MKEIWEQNFILDRKNQEYTIYNNLRKYYRIYVELNNISPYLYIAIKLE